MFYYPTSVKTVMVMPLPFIEWGKGIKCCPCPPTILCRSFWNFSGVLVMVWRCAFGLDIVLRLLLFFFFGHFFRILNLVIFQAWILRKYIDSRYLVCATPPTVLCRSFCHGQKMCMWFGYNPQINFYDFFRILNFSSHFSGSNTNKVYR